MLQPGPGGVGEEQGEVAYDEVVNVRFTQLAGQPVVRKPQFRPRFPRVLSHPGFRGTKTRVRHNHQVCWDQVSHI